MGLVSTRIAVAAVGGFMMLLASATVISPWQKAAVIFGTPVGLAFDAVVTRGKLCGNASCDREVDAELKVISPFGASLPIILYQLRLVRREHARF